MDKFPLKFQTAHAQVIFCALFSTLVVFGHGTLATGSASLGAETESTIRAELIVARAERDSLNQTLQAMQRQINSFRNLVQRPVTVPTGGTGNDNDQISPALFRQLEKEIQFLKNQTSNRQPEALSQTDTPTPAFLLTELHSLRYRIDVLNSSLSNRNLENAQQYLGNLTTLAQTVKNIFKIEREKKQGQIVKELLESYGKNELDRVKSLLDDLTKDNLLNSSMSEIMGEIFAGNLENYPSIIRFFQSTKNSQYKSGVAALIDLFQNKSLNSKRSSSLLDHPEYLNLAFLAKTAFENEFQTKFPKNVQSLIFSEKTLIRNSQSNLWLFVNQEEGQKQGGFSVATTRKSAEYEWEISAVSSGESIIRQRKPNPSKTLNLHVLGGVAYAGTAAQNQNFLWRIQLRKNAQEVTLKSIPGSSLHSSYFLCSAPVPTGAQAKAGTARLAVELKTNGEGKLCGWFVGG